MAEYQQPTDDQLHEMMRRFIKTLPPTVCTITRQEKKEAERACIQNAIDQFNDDEEDDEEKINVSHEVHDASHGEVEHKIHSQIEDLHLSAVLPEHNYSADLSLNTAEMPRRHDVLPHEPSDLQGKALGVSAYLPSCDVA
jgi:hypothetical protein